MAFACGNSRSLARKLAATECLLGSHTQFVAICSQSEALLHTRVQAVNRLNQYRS